MADDKKKKKKNVFQKIAALAKDFEEWLVEHIGDPELAEIKEDLGLNPDNPATPPQSDPARKARIDAFVAKEDVDDAALAEIAADVKELVDGIFTFVDAAKADAVDPWTLFWNLFKVFSLEALRVRNPAGYALVRIGAMATQDEETIPQLDPERLTKLVRGDATEAEGEAVVQGLSMYGGIGTVIAVNEWEKLGGFVDALYGWDPDPEDEGETALIASRALTVILDGDVLGGIRPALTLIGVPKGHGGPGIYFGATAAAQFTQDIGTTRYTFEIAGAGRFGAFVHLDKLVEPRWFAAFQPAIRLSVEPKPDAPLDTPAVLVGTTNATRFEIGAFGLGVELAGDRAATRVSMRKGKLVVALGQGDSFLRQLPGGNVEVPFEVGMVADTSSGFRFEGGTGLRVNLPVAASLFGVFTVQFLELELQVQPKTTLDLRGGFSLQLGPFGASIDRAGLTADLEKISRGVDLRELIAFAPPKGIGLVLDVAGVVKGGGYLFIDAQRGEYAGALELKFLTWSIKAIGLLSTKRPDGSEGWSLLLFVFGQFNVHIAFGIFWTGLGGMVGLHHRSDVDALTAGMRTGALDDVLFPENPVADAPRIINRYRTLFPVQQNNFLIGPMLELSFSEPPIVYVRIGFIFDVRNALGGGRVALSKVILLGQVLVQLPPKETKAPAILKLLIDIVGFYDADTEFLLIRARLRDSFVGIEGFAKLDLAGELLLAMQFGANASFVLSAGGFHPKYEGLPERVPRQLDRLRVSFGIGPVKLSVEHYFAVTPNSVQAGQKARLVADFGVAGIEASLGWDALLYLSPRFYFVVDLEFKAKVKAFGETLASVGVSATLEGPDQWHVKGEFSFSILWWDKTVPFEERWGEVEAAETETASLQQTLLPELSKPDNLAPEAPAGPSLVVLAPAGGTERIAHPLGRLAVRQSAVPFGLQIDRIGTKRLAGGAASVNVESVKLNDQSLPSFEPATQSFARGQYMELSDKDKLTGKVFETFPSGVVVGRTDYVTPAAGLARDVKASFETVRLDPQPEGLMSKWKFVRLTSVTHSYGTMLEASKLGAAARSERAERQQRRASPLAGDAVDVRDPPLAVVGRDDLSEKAILVGAAKEAPSLAEQVADSGGFRVVEEFEVVR